jgi:hypothetical protein
MLVSFKWMPKWRQKSVSCERVKLKQRSATSCVSGLWRDQTLERQPRGRFGVDVSCERVHLKQRSASRWRHRVVRVYPALERNTVPSWNLWVSYSPQIMSWSPQRMRVLRQCKVPRVDVMFVTIHRENIRPSKKEMNKVVIMLKLPDVFS